MDSLNHGKLAPLHFRTYSFTIYKGKWWAPRSAGVIKDVLQPKVANLQWRVGLFSLCEASSYFNTLRAYSCLQVRGPWEKE